MKRDLPRATWGVLRACCAFGLTLGLAQTSQAAPPAPFGQAVRLPAKPSPPALSPALPSAAETIENLRKTQRSLLKRLEKLERARQEQELAELRRSADAEAASAGAGVNQQVAAAKDLRRRSFSSGQRALQALNPEISLIADGLALGIISRRGYASETDRSGFIFRTLGLHFQAALDPFSFAKVAVEMSPQQVALEEAYLTWTGLLPGLSLSVGTFRQQFGVVNRWHEHGYDQQDSPLALRELLGEEGLVQTGIAFSWLLPKLWAHANQLILQLTNGENEQLFAGQFFSIPSVLLRTQSYYNLSEATYFELGLSAMVGWNNRRGMPDEQGLLVDEPYRATWLFGADWTLQWEPLAAAKYRNILLRGELYGVRKDLGAGHSILALGLYQQLEARLSQQLIVGARFDWTQPFAENNGGQYRAAIEPYLTWWQSEWVRLRLHYAFGYSDLLGAAPQRDHRLIAQLTFAIGPHKHERY